MKCTTAALLLVFTFFFTACSKDDVTPVAPQVLAKTMLNVSYGINPLQGMDVYLPPNRHTDSTKVLIMIHGGGWSTGDKADFTQYADTMKRRMPHYAVININYRLASAGVNLFPTQENDVKAAVEFIHSKRTEYMISDKFILLGASAGAHLSLLHGYKYSQPVKIKAIVDLFGPVDMVDLYNNPASIYAPPSAVAAIVGGTPTTNLVMYQQSSPINFVNAQSPPTIVLQGGLDPLVAPSQSATLAARLQAMGVIHQYVYYPGEGHGWFGVNLFDSFNKIQAFLTANVH